LKRVEELYQEIIRRLQEDLQKSPDSLGLRRSLATHAEYLERFLIGQNRYDEAQGMIEIAARNRRAFWSNKQIDELLDSLGSNYYQLGVLADHNNQADAAGKYFRYCRPFWELAYDDLEAKGVPRDSPPMIDRTILRMLAQGRCGMRDETAAAAAELIELAKLDKYPVEKRRSYAMQSAVGYGFCSITFPPGSRERLDYQQKAMASVRYGVRIGYENWDYLATDSDFSPLQECTEFVKFVKGKGK
jgi:hypothetical protein